MPHILIVEDEPATSWALAEGLTDDGFTIDTFRSAEDAWVWLKTGHSDLVISDLRLPGMSGLDLARKLRRGRHAQPGTILTAGGRGRVAAALARRGARERLVLALLLYERLLPVEVADALNLSVRQVERTYDALLAELRRSLGGAAPRDRARLATGAARARKAA